MNDQELIGKVHSSIYHQCQKCGYAAPVDIGTIHFPTGTLFANVKVEISSEKPVRYDAKGAVCAVYVRFIDIEASYGEQA